MESDYYEEVKHQKHNSSDTPLLSVAIIAYNIENFFPAALDSVLCQRTNFNVEIIISDDCSTDKTHAIALQYQQQYSQIIRVLANKKNLGISPNFINAQNACRGKYIALLDGDDYWTNPEKLQLQVDFLENNPTFSACGHQATKIFEDGSPPSLFGAETNAEYHLKDTLTHRKFHTSSVVYRKEFWDKTGGIPPSISSNERALYPMLALFGNIKYFSQSMCVYRLSATNLSSHVTHKELETDLNMLPWLKNIHPKFPITRFRSFLHLCMFTYGGKISIIALIKHYFLFALFSFSYFPKNSGDLLWGSIFFLRRMVLTPAPNRKKV